jgi:hypothetical protein
VRIVDDNKRIRLISSIDLLVATLIIIGGFILIVIWSRSAEIIHMFEELKKLRIDIPLELINFSTFFILILGIFLLIYGSERLINDILKIHSLTKKSISQKLQNQMSGYHRYPPG